MRLCPNLDRNRFLLLLADIAGIYVMYFIAGILHERVYKKAYWNSRTNQQQVCQDWMGIVFVAFAVAWVMAEVYNAVELRQRVSIPHKKSALVAFAIVVASVFSLLAIKKTSFPVVVMFQSCSIVPVVLVGIFCSRVRDQKLKLGPKKIIITAIITSGILLFQFADPETRKRSGNEQFLGILFLLFHFIAEGFLPDLQAEIKVEYKPQPSEMMADINKWTSILSGIFLIASLTLKHFIIFMWQHSEFAFDLIISSILSGFGQFFVYRMIKHFKQHFVPFTIASRKILSVALSIVFYKHETNWLQILGILIVLGAVSTQFLIEVSKPDPSLNPDEKNQEMNEQYFEEENESQSGKDNKSLKSFSQTDGTEKKMDMNQGQPLDGKGEILEPIIQ